jgi:hypothetical protein
MSVIRFRRAGPLIGAVIGRVSGVCGLGLGAGVGEVAGADTDLAHVQTADLVGQ